MPRHLDTDRRSSGRLSKQDPVLVDAQGWQVPRPSLMQGPLSHRPSDAGSHRSKPSPIAADRRRTPKGSSSSGRTKYDHIPRPKNSFFFFRSDFLAAQRLISCHQSQNEISKQSGITWNALSVEEKHPWVLRANQEKIEHQARYPGYVYAPRGRTGSKQRVHTGRVSKSRSKRKLSVRSDSEGLDSLSSSPYPTRLSPESESERVDSRTREASLVPSHVVGAAQLELVVKSEVSSPVASNWAFVPTKDTPAFELSIPKVEKPSESDLSLRPPSYDFIDEPLGFRPIVTPMMDMFLPSMPPPTHTPDIDTEYDLFNQIMDLSTSSATAPPMVLAGCDIEQQIMSSYNYYQPYFDFDVAHISESKDNDTSEMLRAFSVFDDEIPVSPVIRASSISQAEEAEMGQYVDFDYEG